MARRATAIEQLRQEAEGPVLVLDSGDTLFGTTESDRSGGMLLIEAMNAMGYDAMALGAYDLGTDRDTLIENLEQADFDLLSANLGPADLLPMLQPYTLRQVESYTVAIIGATAGRAQDQAETLGTAVETERAVEALQRTVEALEGQAQIIIVLSNLSDNANLAAAQQIPGIDAIIGGRRGQLPSAVTPIDGPDGRVVLQASGNRGQVMGRMILRFDAQGQVLRYEGGTILLSNDYQDDPAMLELLQRYGG